MHRECSRGRHAKAGLQPSVEDRGPELLMQIP